MTVALAVGSNGLIGLVIVLAGIAVIYLVTRGRSSEPSKPKGNSLLDR